MSDQSMPSKWCDLIMYSQRFVVLLADGVGEDFLWVML